MDNLNNKVPKPSHLAEYAIKHLGAELIGVEKHPEKQPPFPCLTGVDGTSGSFRIDKNKYPNIVAAGIDTLELNFGVTEYRQPDVFKQLDDAKSEAVSAGYKGRKGIGTRLFDQDFMVQARGSKGGYEYLLKNGDIDLQMMPEAKGGKPSPELRVIFRSEFLWGKGEVAAYDEVIDFLNEVALLEYCKVSRADLCVDKVMALPEINRKTQVVSLIRAKDLYYGGDFQTGQRETGHTFGRGGIAFRFYDKAFEILLKGHDHMIPLWKANGRDESIPVSRLELQLRRDGLRRFDANMDFATFEESKADIWAYGTDRFLRIVDADSATREKSALKLLTIGKNIRIVGRYSERDVVFYLISN